LLTLFLLLYVFGGDDYLVNLKVVSKTTKCHDFTVIFHVLFQKCIVILPIFYCDFLTALLMKWLYQASMYSMIWVLYELMVIFNFLEQSFNFSKTLL